MNYALVKCRACGASNRVPAARQHLHPKCGRCHVPLDLSGAAVPVELNDTEFQGFVAGVPLPVLAAFLSPTCGYCRMMAPVIHRLARRFANRFIVATIDISRNFHTASHFGIRGVPALLFFKAGRKINQLDGAVSEEILAAKMEAMTTG
jgi:thioredoxin 2